MDLYRNCVQITKEPFEKYNKIGLQVDQRSSGKNETIQLQEESMDEFL